MGARCSPFGASRYDVTFQIWLARSTERDEGMLSLSLLSLGSGYMNHVCVEERERERGVWAQNHYGRDEEPRNAMW